MTTNAVENTERKKATLEDPSEEVACEVRPQMKRRSILVNPWSNSIPGKNSKQKGLEAGIGFDRFEDQKEAQGVPGWRSR